MSTEKLQTVRGTKDLFGSEIIAFNEIINLSRKLGELYGFSELATPIFEFSEIYERNLGEASDIISKEVYKFPDRGGNFLTIRPEFTAGIVRAFISNGELQQILPQKFFSYGPVFRYDRPQKGRQRQFHQINFELIGAGNFVADAEMISLANHILKKLGILENTELEINSLGCELSRNNYQKALVEYFQKFQNDLSEDSKIRLEKNPLRILDSKVEGDIKLVKNAPSLNQFYEKEARENFQNLCDLLDGIGIKYRVNPRLVRGLDYYNSTVFEFVSGEIGAQSTVLAGGRYDNLIHKMGGPNLPAIGFAAGVERLMLLRQNITKRTRPIVINFVSIAEQIPAIQLANLLRKKLGEKNHPEFYVEIAYEGNMKKQLKRSSQLNAQYVITIGEEEIKSGQYSLKNFDNREEKKLSIEELLKFFEL